MTMLLTRSRYEARRLADGNYALFDTFTQTFVTTFDKNPSVITPVLRAAAAHNAAYERTLR